MDSPPRFESRILTGLEILAAATPFGERWPPFGSNGTGRPRNGTSERSRLDGVVGLRVDADVDLHVTRIDVTPLEVPEEE
jgi:hypothetical protein